MTISLEVYQNDSWVDKTGKMIQFRHSLTSRELERIEFTLVNDDVGVGQSVRAKRNDTIFFEGIIYERRKRHDQNYVSVEATAYSPLILYDRQVVYRLYQTGTKAGDIIRDLAALEQDVNTLGVDDGPSLLSNWEIENQTALDVMRSIARGTNYWLRMRPAATFLSFDGVDDYISIPYSSSLNITDNLTVVVRFMTRDASANQKVVSKYPGTPQWILGIISGHTYVELWTTSGTKYVSGYGTIKSNTWHFYGITYRSSDGYYSVYVDDAKVGTKTTDGNPLRSSTGGIIIGRITATGSYLLNGAVSQVLIYNRVLSDSEIQWNYLNPLNPVRSGLVLWLKMNEGKGGVAYDYSGYNNHGTIYGAAWGYEKNPAFVNSYVLEYRPKVIA